MDNGQRIYIIGILKGMASQTDDSDIKFALGECIDIQGKLIEGYELTKPQEKEEPIIEDNEVSEEG